jgi:hypothetical protein
VQDLLALVSFLKEEQPNRPIHVIGVESAGPVVLHAAALDSRIESVKIVRGLATWSSVVKTPISHNQFTNVVPGALRTYDLPDLAATLAPRPLTIVDAMDPVGKLLTKEQVVDEYSGCVKSYKAAKAPEMLRLGEAPR